MSMLSRSRHASMAAEPVSPEVAAVRMFDDAFQIGVGDGAADKGLDYLECQIRVAKACKAGDLAGGELRPTFRHIETAVPGQARQQHVVKGKGWCLAAGAYIFHGKIFRLLILKARILLPVASGGKVSGRISRPVFTCAKYAPNRPANFHP